MSARAGATTLAAAAVAGIAGWWAFGPPTLTAPPPGPAVERAEESAPPPAPDARPVLDAAATPVKSTAAAGLPRLMGELGGGAPPGDPAVVDRFLAAHDQAELALIGALSRHDLEPPPALEQLFALRRGGARAPELLRFVRDHFPRDPRLRLEAARWIDGLGGPAARGRRAAALRIKRDPPRRPLGVIERVADPGGTAGDAASP